MMKNAKKGTREGFLIVPVSNAEKEAIKNLADSRGLTMSALTRMVLLEQCKMEEKKYE